MRTRILKWGNSLAVRIPGAFVRKVHVSNGSSVDLRIDGRIVIDPRIEHEYRLDDLLKGITNDNMHAEIDTGEVAGREGW